MTGHPEYRPLALAAAPALVALALMADPAFAQDSCKLTPIGSGTVASVRDGRTLMLADGQTLRLERLGPGSGTDRYGRLVAFAFLPEAGRSAQQVLLEQGEGLVSARIGDKSCADSLLATERGARAAKRGLWADPNFAPLSSENLPALEAARGRFALVEGRVLSVRESGATIYMNLGRRWTRDFTVTVLKRQQRTFAAAGLDVRQLEGRRIRVRGWVERRGGPIIEAAAPEQIELID
ncbi:MAG: thermonuclease family protein [Pseudolabrys sp.]|nr:thermonuclease family protein [Pseudolabrys sp.]